MVHVVVHPGFHKTGTSSLQSLLGQNRRALKPYLTFYGKADFLAAGSAARIYGQKPYPWRLRAFRRTFDRFLASIPDAPVIVLSRETFSGSMPGHRRFPARLIRDYRRAAVPLGQQIIAALRARFGEDVQITFLYTLRDRESWIRSIYGHLLRSIHLRDDYDRFRARFPDLIAPRTEAEAIAKTLGVTAHFVTLEETGPRREGPASAVLDLLGVPQAVRDGLPPATRANAGQTRALEDRFLTMNRASREKAALKAAKDALLKAARVADKDNADD
ncbi:hypothetical protein ACOI1H_12185 [Loktanella sp. DJP18]|uniref:hypothetical protein n=1 Tax=Loktanella sp. DJP18 TaxID=3409788 RepID=UPI003BB4F05E